MHILTGIPSGTTTAPVAPLLQDKDSLVELVWRMEGGSLLWDITGSEIPLTDHLTVNLREMLRYTSSENAPFWRRLRRRQEGVFYLFAYRHFPGVKHVVKDDVCLDILLMVPIYVITYRCLYKTTNPAISQINCKVARQWTVP